MHRNAHRNEVPHRFWWGKKYIFNCLQTLPENNFWNALICILVLSAILWIYILDEDILIDLIYNILYAIHVLCIAYKKLREVEIYSINWKTILSLFVDLTSFLHYVVDETTSKIVKLICYFLRLHRPFQYLLSDRNMKASIFNSTMKYWYILLVLRITCTIIYMELDLIKEFKVRVQQDEDIQLELLVLQRFDEDMPKIFNFLCFIYLINKMFLPIGSVMIPTSDKGRISCMVVTVIGSLGLGAVVASMSLVISIYMRPEESFRARFRLIMKELTDSNLPPSLCQKVETFYKMYWHKQRAVSATQLLPIFPPSLSSAVYTDIYFQATQKSRILRDLSYQFLSELAKKMVTIHYIPGDAVIHRNSTKSSVIFISYGDVEMLTAEDDSTAILRMTRGTILSQCGCASAAACARAHVEIRAATFCTAHVLAAADLWRIASRHGNSEQVAIMLAAFDEHLDQVKSHFNMKIPVEVKYKSSILHFKRALMEELKELRDGVPLGARAEVMLEVAGCYIMRNRADMSLTDESDAICLRPTFPCILQPFSSLLLVWNIFIGCVILLVCFTHPYNLVYLKEPSVSFRFFDYTVTLIFALDIMSYLSTGTNVEDGVPITLAQTSFRQSKSQWFFLDVLGTVPMFEFIGDGHHAGINKLLRLPKVFRLLKDLSESCAHYVVYHSNVVRFLTYTLLMVIACYFIATIQEIFMCSQYNYCQVTNFTHAPHWTSEPRNDSIVGEQIKFGLYWAISVITFTSHREGGTVHGMEAAQAITYILYSIIVLELCVMLHIFVEAVYSATIMVTTALREDYDACIETVTNFLIRNDVDPLLRERFIMYLQLGWYTDKAYSMTHKKSSIMHDLPPHVYQDIVTWQRSKYILCIPFMKLLHKEELKDVSSKAKLFYTSPNEILLNTGDISNEMYVIKRGICEILSPVTKDVVGELSVKNHFGVLECLLRVPAFYTIRAVSHVQLFSISRKYLLNALEIPKIKDAIDFAKEQPEYLQLQERYKPFVWYKPLPPAPNVERFRQPRKHEHDYVFLHPFYTLGFLSVLRYIFPRFTIHPDGCYLRRCERIRGVCALASALLFPSYTYLVLQFPRLYFLATLLDISAYFDIVQRMLVGYYNEKGILVYHPASTAAHYVKGTFIVDLLACLPLEGLELEWKENYRGKYYVSVVKQYLMMNRLLQLYRSSGALDSLTSVLRADILLIIKATPLFLALLSVLTCNIVFDSVIIYYPSDNQSLFIDPFLDDSWLDLFGDTFRFNLTETPWNLHLGVYFWVVYEATSTGYGVFQPSHPALMTTLFVGMLAGAMIVTYLSVRVISIRANVNKPLAAFQQDMRDMLVFMRREKLDDDLQREVVQHYQYKWEKTEGVEYRSVLKLCNQITLRTDAVLNLYGSTFALCPVLARCDISAVRLVGRAVRSVHVRRAPAHLPHDLLPHLYLVHAGTLAVPFATLAQGSMFGNLEGVPTIRCPISAIATNEVHLLQINSCAFYQIIADFPSIVELMKTHRPHHEFYIEGLRSVHEGMRDRAHSHAIVSQRIHKHLRIKHSFIQMYITLISLGCIYADVYNVGFQDNRPGMILALYALDLAFCIKFLMLYYLLCIVDEEDDVRVMLMKERRRYFKLGFKVDMVSCMPLEVWAVTSGGSWMLFSFLRMNRMLRIVTVYECLRRHRLVSVGLAVSTALTVAAWFTVTMHAAAAAYHLLALLEDDAKSNSSWLYDDKGQLMCDNEYICSLYFVLTTFAQNGIGDIMPKKQSEVVFVIALQLVSTMMYMIYVGEFSNLIQFHSFRSFSFYSKYLELQDFLRNNRVSRNLSAAVSKYSDHLWCESRGSQLPQFLEHAPHCLRLSLMCSAYCSHLSNHHIFQCCEAAFLRQLAGCLKLYTFNEGMYVVKQRDVTDSMYFIHTGKVRESCETDNQTKVYSTGEYFGVGLVHNLRFTKSYQTITKSQVLTLRLNDWENLVKHYPESYDCIFNNIKYDDDSNDDIKRDDKKDYGQHNLDSDSPNSKDEYTNSSTPDTPLTTLKVDDIKTKPSALSTTQLSFFY